MLEYRDTSVPTMRDITIQEQPWNDIGGQFFIPAIPEEGSIGGEAAAIWTQGTGTPIGALQHVAWEQGDLFVLLTTSGGLSADDTEQIAASLSAQS